LTSLEREANPGDELRRCLPASPGNDDAWKDFLRDVGAQGFAELVSAKTEFRDPPDRRVLANEKRGSAFGAERKPLAGWGPGRAPIDDARRDWVLD
jgi:hypothetical protein